MVHWSGRWIHSPKIKLKSKAFIVDPNGALYVRVKYAGMHPMCILIDGIPTTRFHGIKSHCLKIEDAIKWHEREIETTRGAWKRTILDLLLNAKHENESKQK